jgi:hypothetical protein
VLDEVREREAELLVLPLPRRRHGSALLARTADAILRRAPVRVLVVSPTDPALTGTLRARWLERHDP